MGRFRLTALFVLAAALQAGGAGAGLQGPIRGHVELGDGALHDDVVVRLSCQANALHGAHRADQESRVIDSRDAYLFLFAWRGLWPRGCALEVMHPLYRQVHLPLTDAFWQKPDPIRIEAWAELLEDSTAELSEADLYRHLFYLRHYYLPALGNDTSRLARHVPDLHRILARGLDVFPPMSNDRFGSRDSALEDLRAIEKAVDFKRPPAQRDLFVAAAAGEVDGLLGAIARGADPDAWSSEGRAALHLAAEAGHRDAVIALLDAGADVDQREEGLGKTALLLATQMHRTETVLVLIERGADVTLATRGVTPLTAVARQGTQPEVLDALLSAGAITSAREERHRTDALVAAGRNGRTSIVEALLAQGVPVDAGLPGWTSLMAASKTGKTRTVRFLIDAGANVNARTTDGRTALSLAREGHREEVIRMLLSSGAVDDAGTSRSLPGSAASPGLTPGSLRSISNTRSGVE